ncbi:Tyrosine aminotransferase [Smittium mucronatum]|uniref:Tyrosine aminotransferase n=1 Tax=Smittium mucronatum TaxID=133383 RepID=A0A1R0GWY5_9FUNG|nr:Tyrosine aminotransferase [Smittium mucronatum]
MLAEDFSDWKPVSPSKTAIATINPIRGLLDSGVAKQTGKESSEPVINMSLGDPTIFGNFKTHPCVIEAVEKQLKSYHSNGYAPSSGNPQAREAIAKAYSDPDNGVIFHPQDVILASGCSGAVEMSIVSLCSEGDNILLPKPGFPLYKTNAESRGVNYKLYNLLAEKQWEADLPHLESLIDDKTKAILINNPSNPCGSNWSKEHVAAIIDICAKHRIPLISDEIYNGIVFPGVKFTSAASVSKNVPVLTLGGIAKRYLVPGWRVGWVTLHDPLNVLVNLRPYINNLTAIINGPNTLIQKSLPDILSGDFNEEFSAHLNSGLETNAKIIVDRASAIKGLTPIVPEAAMYIMILIDPEIFDSGIRNSVDFFNSLMWEEHVEVLPGDIFDFPNSFRVVITPPPEKLIEAFDRIKLFCERHYKS